MRGERKCNFFYIFAPPSHTGSLASVVLLVALAAKSSMYNLWEGCVHMYTPYAQPFPGTLLATGTEDYFDSAFGFDTRRFHGPVS